MAKNKKTNLKKSGFNAMSVSLLLTLVLVTAQLPLLGANEGHIVGVIANIVPGDAPGDVVINEFLPNPSGDDDALKPAGEWVELYNRGGTAVDVSNWALYDSIDTHELLITAAVTDTGGTIVPAGGRLVVYRNGDTDFVLNNSGGDSVRLFNALIILGGTLVDSHAYTANAATDKTTARIPDGTDNWVDPIPTPGEPNQLSEEEISGEPVEYTYDPDEDVEIEDGDPFDSAQGRLEPGRNGDPLPLAPAPARGGVAAEEPAADETPVEEVTEAEPADEETPPAEETTEPGDETLTDETPADEPVTEPEPTETPADETGTNETPADETTEEEVVTKPELPADEPATEPAPTETPADENMSDETPADEPVDETPVDDQPADTGTDQGAEPQPPAEQPDQTVTETPTIV